MHVLASENYNNFMCPFFTSKFIEHEMEIEKGDRNNYYSFLALLLVLNFHLLFNGLSSKGGTSCGLLLLSMLKKLKC